MSQVIPIAIRRGAMVARQLAPRRQVALALAGFSEQLANAGDLLGCGRTDEGRLVVADVVAEINELRAVLEGDRSLVDVHELYIKRKARS